MLKAPPPENFPVRAPFDIQYTAGLEQSFDEMFYAKNVGCRYRGANKRSEVNTLVFPNPRGTAASPPSFWGNKNQCLFPRDAIRILITRMANCVVFV